jgi:hypothetical protein
MIGRQINHNLTAEYPPASIKLDAWLVVRSAHLDAWLVIRSVCERWLAKNVVKSLTSSNVHEVLAGGLVDLYVAVANVMLVTSEK